MIDPTEWDRRPIAGGVVLRAPGGATRLRVRPRLAARRLGVLVAEACAEHGVTAVEPPAVSRLVTENGELGALASVACEAGVELAIAAVGGASLCCIDASGPPGVASLVASLARRCGTGLGELRARMFEYAAPPGWRGLRRETASLWAHPDYPRNDALIAVHDARPMTASPTEKLHRVLFARVDDRAIDGAEEPASITGAGGLEGRIRAACAVDARGRSRVRQVAAFGDGRFLYQAMIDAPAEDRESLAVFTSTIESFQPLPLPSENAASSFSHWVE